MCEKCLKEIYERGHIPIVTGGTGFYIQALLKDIDFTENEENKSYSLQRIGAGEEINGVFHLNVAGVAK